MIYAKTVAYFSLFCINLTYVISGGIRQLQYSDGVIL